MMDADAHLPLAEIRRQIEQAQRRVPRRTFWRHKRTGRVYEVQSHGFDTERDVVMIGYTATDDRIADGPPIALARSIDNFLCKPGTRGLSLFEQVQRTTEWNAVKAGEE